jgi:YD repeat-containing protein
MNLKKLVFLLLLLPTLALSGVNLKNGNFYVSYTDIIVPGGGHDLKMVRTYNSKSLDKGWFGFGWGSDYETYIVVAADGSVVVHENGSGARTRFTPREAVNAQAASERIIEAMRKKSSLSQQVVENLKKKLAKDAELRQAYARKFKVKAKLANGTMLYSNQRGLQKLKKVKSGFVRMYNDGKNEFFNEVGKLEKIKDKNGYFISINYNKTGNVKSIKDSQAKQLFFDWFPDNKIKYIWSVGDKKTAYKFKGQDLIQSTDVGGNIYRYGYDTNHNLTTVTYGDTSQMKVKYTSKTQFASEVVTRKGISTKYEYESDPKNSDLHYWTFVTKSKGKGKSVKNKYEYEIKVRPDGSQYTYRIYTKISSVETETIYSECCSLPIKIKRGKHVTTFEYNKSGLLTKKSSTKGEYIQLEYHKKFNKITRVVNNKGWTNFDYDKKGNLAKAVNSRGKSVLLLYDRKGRITKMIDKNKKVKKTRSLSFKYNSLGKPVEIAMEKVGKIFVSYDNYGEIKKVDSKSGSRMALQVTQAFQSLLAIVKPAGVNLNM